MFRDPSDLEALDDFLDGEGIRADVTERASRDVAPASEPPKKERARQIRPKLRAALVAIVESGAKISDAAGMAGLSYEGLRIALRRPHIQAELSRIKRAWLDNETGKAFLVVAKLANGAASEDVQLRAARFLIEQDAATRAALPPSVQNLVQIINHGGGRPPDVSISTPNASGVFEMAPFQPARRLPPGLPEGSIDD